AHSVREQFIDVARGRGADLSSRETVLDSKLALLQFGDAGLDRAQLLLSFGRGVLIHGDDLHANLAGPHLGAGDAGPDLALLAHDARVVALGCVYALVLDDLAVE